MGRDSIIDNGYDTQEIILTHSNLYNSIRKKSPVTSIIKNNDFYQKQDESKLVTFKNSFENNNDLLQND